eukprot:PhF_6_TR3734/c0_g1_i2/m.5364
MFQTRTGLRPAAPKHTTAVGRSSSVHSAVDDVASHIVRKMNNKTMSPAAHSPAPLMDTVEALSREVREIEEKMRRVDEGISLGYPTGRSASTSPQTNHYQQHGTPETHVPTPDKSSATKPATVPRPSSPSNSSTARGVSPLSHPKAWGANVPKTTPRNSRPNTPPRSDSPSPAPIQTKPVQPTKRASTPTIIQSKPKQTRSTMNHKLQRPVETIQVEPEEVHLSDNSLSNEELRSRVAALEVDVSSMKARQDSLTLEFHSYRARTDHRMTQIVSQLQIALEWIGAQSHHQQLMMMQHQQQPHMGSPILDPSPARKLDLSANEISAIGMPSTAGTRNLPPIPPLDMQPHRGIAVTPPPGDLSMASTLNPNDFSESA